MAGGDLKMKRESYWSVYFKDENSKLSIGNVIAENKEDAVLKSVKQLNDLFKRNNMSKRLSVADYVKHKYHTEKKIVEVFVMKPTSLENHRVVVGEYWLKAGITLWQRIQLCHAILRCSVKDMKLALVGRALEV